MAGKPRVTVVVLLLISVSVFVFVVGYFFGKRAVDPYQNSDTSTGCTMEAKLCPDGSAVGREGPDCQFTDCSDSMHLKGQEEQ